MCFGHIPKDLLSIIANNYGFVNTPVLDQFEAKLEGNGIVTGNKEVYWSWSIK
jgi:hypothetical protein